MAYGRLKEFDREITILEELLAQPRWRRGKRGAWYDRWALILMHHLVREKREIDGQLVTLAKDEQKDILRQAMRVIIRGLEDDDTHIGMFVSFVVIKRSNSSHSIRSEQASLGTPTLQIRKAPQDSAERSS